MILNLSDLSSEPLHGQISRQIRAKILAGDLCEGTDLPSIRALAKEQQVSVITVQRSYEDLEREGLIQARRGKGFFVASLSSEQKETMAMARLVETMRPLIEEALAEGLNPEQIAAQCQRLIRSLTKATKGGVLS
ncbi:GntR family transcriptional regulator [soil metagenome]|jgi:GntR family transcriptional regulator